MSLGEYLEHHPKKYLIFDLDRTLARLEIDWSTYRREIFDIVATFDSHLSASTPFEAHMGIRLANEAVQKHGKKAKTVLDAFNETYELTHYHGYTPNPALLSFIRAHKNHYSFFLWTANCRKTILDFLQKEQLTGTFKKIITLDDVDYVKPDPDGFTKIYDRENNKDHYLMIGDRFTDEGAAKAAGIDYWQDNYFIQLKKRH